MFDARRSTEPLPRRSCSLASGRTPRVSQDWFTHSAMPLYLDLSSLTLVWAALTSLVVCLGIAFTTSWHGRLTLDTSIGVQKFHTTPTPRVGGVGIVLALYIALMNLPGSVASIVQPMLLAATLAFVSGLAEDVTKRVSVRERLLATVCSGVAAWWLSGVTLTRLDVWGLDYLLQWLPFSVLFTAFAAAGVANAINIIDGFNGLAAGVILIALLALGAVAHGAGDPDMVKVCLLLGAATIGFLLVNFPFGKIFLGDGGAYLLGFMLGWVAVLVSVRNPEVSPWASLLACAYPILEVLFSVARRSRRRTNPGHPDRLHMHSLLKCRVTRKLLPNSPAVMKNSAVSPIVWGFSSVPAAAAVLWSDSTPILIAAFAACALLYALVYRRLVRFRW
ncbi:glycosyltransferase [Ramlibacter sp. AN1015]|uniref:MraY family glycosyltransferase n=1 Tax=Ramlibacter sp. AN1015 TaxID=3133428 RepID=UPI0030BD81D6